MAVIEVKNLTKEYRLGAITTFKGGISNLFRRLQGKPAIERKIFKALDGINFTIDKGEVVGVIGTNGAGKSTLLKHLAKITTPTSGSVNVSGTVAPLIEVGAGFVPDLTGRENIYLNGSIMGLSRKEVTSKIDEIIEFAELEDFIDTPVKRYSSGMAVRLGFAVATSIDAQILIVDEVLAVGDLAFQRKCFERIEEMIKRRGKTVLLVSHNIRQVERLCTRAILLDKGRVVADGNPGEISNIYYTKSNEKVMDYHENTVLNNAQKSGEVDLISIEVLDKSGEEIEKFFVGDCLRVRVSLQFNVDMVKPEIVVGTHRTDFVYLTAGSTAVLSTSPDYQCGTHQVEYMIDSYPLIAGIYAIRVAVFDQYRRVVFSGEMLKLFSVEPLPNEVRNPPLRTLDLPTRWSIDGVTYE